MTPGGGGKEPPPSQPGARRARAAAGRPRTCCGRRPPPGLAALPLLAAARSQPCAQGRPQQQPPSYPRAPQPPAAPHLRDAGSRRSCPRPPPCLLRAERGCSAPRIRRPGQVRAPRPPSPAGGSCPRAGEGGPGTRGRVMAAPLSRRRGQGEQPARTASSLGSPGLAAIPVFPQVYFFFPSEGFPPRWQSSLGIGAERNGRFWDGDRFPAGVWTVGGRSGGHLTSPGGAQHRLGKSCAAVVCYYSLRF